MAIGGKWNGGNNEITVNNKVVTVTMGTRPNGSGALVSENPDIVYVNFPDDRPYTGTLINDRQIQWCGVGPLRTDNVWNRV